MKQPFGETSGIKVFLSLVPGETLQSQETASEIYRRDWSLRDLLEVHLQPLCRQGLIAIWHPGKLVSGQRWRQEIEGHLAAADILVLLLSAQFLADESCYAQMEQALERFRTGRARVVPVFLRHVDNVQALPVGELAPLPVHAEPLSLASDLDQAASEVAEGLRLLVEEQLRSAAVSPSDIHFSLPTPGGRNVLNPLPVFPASTALLPRTEQRAAIARLLAQSENTAVMLTGLGGIGKTILAGQIYQEYATPAFWFDLSPTVMLADVVGSLCQALGRPLPVFENPTAPVQELFVLLREVDCLLVLDGFESWLALQNGQVPIQYAGVRELLALLHGSGRTCAGRVLCTSRLYPYGVLSDPGHVQEFPVAGLSVEESIQLLRLGNCASIERAAEEDLIGIANHCQGHALTLAWVRGLLARDAALTPASLLRAQHEKGLWVSERMFELLTRLYREYFTPEQRVLLLAFAIYREAVPFAAALAIVDLLLPEAQRDWSLTRLGLLDQGLLQVSGNGYYHPHPVVGDFLQERSLPAEREMQTRAHLGAANYYQARLQSLPEPRQERQNSEKLHASVEAAWHLCKAGEHARAYQLMQASSCFAQLHRQGQSGTLLVLYQELQAGAFKPSEPSQAAGMSNELGEIYEALGQKERALRAYQEALTLFRQTGEQERIVEVLANLGAMYRVCGEPSEALACYQEALTCCEQAPGELVWRGRILHNLGKLVYEEGIQEERHNRAKKARQCYQRSLKYYRQAVAWHQRHQLSLEEAFALNNLGDVYQALHDYRQAQTHYLQALEYFRAQRDRRHEAIALNNLGLLSQDMARQNEDDALLEEARTRCEQALHIFREVGDRWQERRVLRNLGRFYLTYPHYPPQQRYTYSLACFAAASQIAEELLAPQDTPLPHWIEKTIRQELGDQPFEELLEYTMQHAERIVRGLSQTIRPCAGQFDPDPSVRATFLRLLR